MRLPQAWRLANSERMVRESKARVLALSRLRDRTLSAKADSLVRFSFLLLFLRPRDADGARGGRDVEGGGWERELGRGGGEASARTLISTSTARVHTYVCVPRART